MKKLHWLAFLSSGFLRWVYVPGWQSAYSGPSTAVRENGPKAARAACGRAQGRAGGAERRRLMSIGAIRQPIRPMPTGDPLRVFHPRFAELDEDCLDELTCKKRVAAEVAKDAPGFQLSVEWRAHRGCGAWLSGVGGFSEASLLRAPGPRWRRRTLCPRE